jgi:undecaprenyl pyrophosphate synthase
MADERDRLRRQLGLSPTPTPVTADADPLAALQTSVAESKAQVEKKNIEIPTIALEQAVNTGDKNAIVDAAKAVAKAQGGSARKVAQATVESDREAVQNASGNARF